MSANIRPEMVTNFEAQETPKEFVVKFYRYIANEPPSEILSLFSNVSIAVLDDERSLTDRNAFVDMFLLEPSLTPSNTPTFGIFSYTAAGCTYNKQKQMTINQTSHFDLNPPKNQLTLEAKAEHRSKAMVVADPQAEVAEADPRADGDLVQTDEDLVQADEDLVQAQLAAVLNPARMNTMADPNESGWFKNYKH
ncbi:hypothetical protein WR25_09038 [Diploscapter pachys]|uniref:NTF2 domain-containing protein n=1 Tax=Diploscapter pachys TaxID=2018661 RepID=A0A2A2K6C3_9BILA|nr:hypothetical protein WR25_09038 [Diploscapter pachys]